MQVNKVHAAVVAALSVVGGLAIQSAAVAQEGLEEIVVTATRREQNLQEVPISIVAITGDSLEIRGLENVENLNATVPNLSVMGSAGGTGTSATTFRVRGIPGVGVYVDGIWQVNTAGMLTEDFGDLDRLEVLRGPQGTLFGRESIGGAIRVFTKRPTDELGGTVKGTIGSHNRRDATASLNLPLSENVKTKFTFAEANRDGYIRSLTTGVKGGGIDQTNVTGDIVWTPTEKLDIRALYSRMDTSLVEPRVADAVWLGNGFFPATAGLLYDNAGLPYSQDSQMSGWPGGTVGKWENRSEITNPNNITKEQRTLDVKLALSDKISLQFLTGYTDLTTKIFIDYDNSQFGLVEDTSNSHVNLWSQEFQIAGGGDRIQWVAGAFIWDTKTRTRGVGYAFEEFNINPVGVNPAIAPASRIAHPSNDNAYVTALYATPFCQALAANPTPPPGPASTCQGAMAYYKAFSTLLANPMGGSLTQSGNDGNAFFGEVTMSLTDKLTLALGARSHSQESYSQRMTPTSQAPLFVNREFGGDPLAGIDSPGFAPTIVEFDKTTGRASLQYQFSDEVMGYTSFSRGFNPGGTQTVIVPGTNATQVFSFTPEIVENMEIGLRSDLANNRVRINATLFDTTWDNIQQGLALQSCDTSGCFDTRSTVTYNVGNAHARGIELEMVFAPTDKLTLNVNLGFLDTGFDDILFQQNVTGATAVTLGYVAGETEFSQAPENTYNIGVQYDATLGNGASLTTRFDYSYVSQYWRAADPRYRVAWYAQGSIPPGFSDESGDFGTFNARLTYAPADGKWDVSVFGTNLTDEYQLNSGFFHGIWGYDFATVGRPREIGSTLTFHF